MMKRKRVLPALLVTVLLLGAACPLALGADTGRRVFDQADLLTPAQEAGLEADIAQFQKDTGMDFVLVTTRQPHEGVSVQTVADDFTTNTALAWMRSTAARCTTSICTGPSAIGTITCPPPAR